MASARVADLLRELTREKVEFIVVGMASAVLHGAPLLTLDLDLVHRRSVENVERLLRVLERVNARYRDDPRNLRPTASHLIGPGHQLLTTSLGDIDVLGSIDGDRTYEDILAHTVPMDLDADVTLRVLDLEEYIGMKERARRPKDLAALPALRATLEEMRKRLQKPAG
jgi:hypothetical protein